MASQLPQPDGKTLFGAVTAVAAVYGYFLIFAQFGFLKAAQAMLGNNPGAIRVLMTLMGVAGIGGSVLAARLFEPRRGRILLAVALGLCAVAAGGALTAETLVGFGAVAGLIGLGCGSATVITASLLGRAVGGARLGVVVGLGTGLAYACCNLPGIFDARAKTQAWLAILAAATGALAGGALRPAGNGVAPTEWDYSRAGIVSWVMIFVALVSLDSGAFFLIQHNAELKAATWSGAGKLGLNAAVHLFAAVLAGMVVDRGRLGVLVALAAGGLLAACWLIVIGDGNSGTRLAVLYTAGVSIYSTALVYYPARGGRAGLAALVYAIAGWGGSALGIAFAGNGTHLPAAFLLGAGGVILAGLAVRWARSAGRHHS